MTGPRPAGTPGTWAADGGASRRMASMRLAALSPANGRRPAHASKSVTPKA